MARQIIKTTIETIETTGFTLKQMLCIETKCFLRRQVNATTPLLHNDMLMSVVG